MSAYETVEDICSRALNGFTLSPAEVLQLLRLHGRDEAEPLFRRAGAATATIRQRDLLGFL